LHHPRHTAATLALQAGVPLWKVSKMLGHRDISITLRGYGYLSPEGRDDIADRLEQVLGPRDQATVV
jgi:integrase